MKFKVKPEKSNLFLMTIVLMLCLFTCLLWLVLREYIYFSIYSIITLLLGHMYYFTSYIINEKYLIIKLGLLNIKIKYNKIMKVENLKDKVKVYLKTVNINLHPKNKDIFVAKLSSKLTNKNS